MSHQPICFRFPHSPAISERDRKAAAQVRRAGVGAPESAVLAWVRSVGPDSILSAKLSDIRAVANAF